MHQRLHLRHLPLEMLDQLLQTLRRVGAEEMAEAVHELLELRLTALEPITQHLVERLEHVLDFAEVLGFQLLHGAGHVLEVGLGDLLFQLLHQLLEGLRRTLVHELVVVELADRPADVFRQVVELLQLLLPDLLQHPLGAVRRLLQSLVDALALAPQNVVQPLADVAEDVVEVVALQLLEPLLPQPLEHLLESGEALPLAIPPASAHQAVQRVVEIATLKQVLR